MCGIVGYIGQEDCKNILIDGLKKLEYRGYDSSGIAIKSDGFKVFKEKGRVADMEATVTAVQGSTGIAHTRWATHGVPNKTNAHPHLSSNGRFSIVHNGVIENHKYLKNEYLKDFKFVSETDSEVLANLLELFTEELKSVEKAIQKLIKVTKGSFALVIMDLESDLLYGLKNMSPLLIGKGDGFNMFGSDVSCMLSETNEFYEFHDLEYAVINETSIHIYDQLGNPVVRGSFVSKVNLEDTELGAYPHYMLKEIEEQSSVIRRILTNYFGDYTIDLNIINEIQNADRINIIAAGTSYHAGLVIKSIFEEVIHKPVDVHIASEFVYHTPLLSEKPFFIFISQSGETADSRAALLKVRTLGYKSMTLTNVEGSTLSREADYTLLLFAGPEIAVASTKAYTAQIAVCAILASQVNPDYVVDLQHELTLTASVIDDIVSIKDTVKEFAKHYLLSTRNCFYIGRGMDYFVALEAALKLKEISYIQTEGFAAGELKHGTIALIEDGIPVIAIVSQAKTALNTRGNIKEVEARGANTLTISFESISEETDELILRDVHPLLTPLVTIIPTQYLSYYAALDRGLDIDKPRNLAKSVTVE